MKRMKIIIALLFLTLLTYCQEDKIFKEQITVEKGIKFGDGTIQLTAPTNSADSVKWENISGKPKEIELVQAISELQGIVLPVLTTSQINSLTPKVGTLVYDSSLNVLKIYTGTWKVIITNL